MTTPEQNPVFLHTQIQLDPAIYTASSEALMQQRGILVGDETMTQALERSTGALLEMDEELQGYQDTKFADTVVDLVNRGVIVYGTPILTHAGRDQEVTAACTVLPVRVKNGQVDVRRFAADSFAALDKSLGTGYDLSDIEDPAGALLDLNGQLDRINDYLVSNQQRPVASMATLRADHPGVVDFVRTKREADFSKWRFNLSVFVTEDLFEAAQKGEVWNLTDDSGAVVDTMPAAELLKEIAECAHYCGEPGILFKDRINADNPTPQWEYKSTAPCAEVAMAAGEACQFSYINVASLGSREGLAAESFGEAVKVMTRLLDASVEYTIRNSEHLQLPLVERKRRIGVGITGFADLLVKMGVPYDSPEAVKIATSISELMDYNSKVESAQLAKQRGAFPAFFESRYADPEWQRRKLPRTTGVVSEEQWETLFDEIDSFGIRHASTTSLPPTGTSSAIVGSSKSLEPHFSLADYRTGMVHRVVMEDLRQRADAETILGAIALSTEGILDDDTLALVPHLTTARQISPDAHLNVQAGFQSFLDEALAKTINLPEEATPDDVLQSLWSAYRLNLKGLTVFRDNSLGTRSTKA